MVLGPRLGVLAVFVLCWPLAVCVQRQAASAVHPAALAHGLCLRGSVRALQASRVYSSLSNSLCIPARYCCRWREHRGQWARQR